MTEVSDKSDSGVPEPDRFNNLENPLKRDVSATSSKSLSRSPERELRNRWPELPDLLSTLSLSLRYA
ncbi:hypothetical protein OGATHE_004546 [Ogataea polymorpha]|uniref:Uncharacterized protein n=1 Tax=Ogataea polymorpha TaxID=460523 RepID=A0A9P8P095_9ASCO|nr:hypothetical protein OGATHE_004546 [Ogataea polymorpha]